MPGPMAPSELGAWQTQEFPEEVWTAFNKLIARRWNGSMAIFRQDEVVKAIVDESNTLTSDVIFERGYLNVEEAYEAQGWRVTYDKPGFNETYHPTFTFRRTSA